MSNKQILIKHKATFNNSDRYKVIGLMDAVRKDEALKVFEYILTDGVPFWFTTTPEQLYEIYQKKRNEKRRDNKRYQ